MKASQRSLRSAMAIAAFAVLLCGCPKTIQVKDDAASFASARALWHRNLSAEARLSTTVDPGDFLYPSLEAALVLKLGERAALRGGYFWLQGNVDPPGSDSDVRVKIRGPGVGLVANF